LRLATEGCLVLLFQGFKGLGWQLPSEFFDLELINSELLVTFFYLPVQFVELLLKRLNLGVLLSNLNFELFLFVGLVLFSLFELLLQFFKLLLGVDGFVTHGR
jgi:hypothetical protein